MTISTKWAKPLALAVFMAIPTALSANPIERACNASDRDASRSLCSCIGDVAGDLLTRAQMREGARWFDDPQRAQDTRQSDRARDEEMWQAWRTFSTAAQQRCG
ncbi:hypothetical protein [Gymnodinialimonas hymeniacidonis]|uniref:hypothetical protein n=1 Tax=Gymnodinialimonas hymeniacidonis TaxID=3126508 RepID=UPI0034C673E3